MTLHALEQLVAPWQSAYSNSTLISTTVTAVHLVALLVAGGLAIAADRTTLRALRAPAADRTRQLQELHAVHRPVLVALTVLFVSGIALAAADLDTFLGSTAFWIKMGLVALLVVNGVVLTRAESRLRTVGDAPAETHAGLWRLLRVSSVASLVLWVVTTVAGTVLVNA